MRSIPLLALGLIVITGIADAQVAMPGYDNKAPIEIVADALTVRQQEQLALFNGNVEATQGEMSLRADELKVFYDQGKGDQGKGQTPAPTGEAQSIRRIEANGRVVVAAPDQNATSDRGTYDVTTGRIRLEGNVVLTRIDNVVRGTTLDLELATGIARLTGGKGSERVRALFRPDDAKTGAPGKPQVPK